MKNIKNYRLHLIKRDPVKITKEEADQVLIAWEGDAKFIVLKGSVYATHQISSIEKIKNGEELPLLENMGYLPKLSKEEMYTLDESPRTLKRRELLKRFEEKLTIGSFPKLSKNEGRTPPEILNPST